MYLKKLVLHGFKSFADRTEFVFEPGITGLVGPNGCGKSNVVDAMKWILGEQSAKSLRGTQMADVIFNGGAGRKASSYAEASLTIAGAHKVLPTDHDEVEITRRLYRNGESDYLINKQTARLKDIRALFFDTGIGTSTYSFIEQGRVDQLLAANAQQRRVVFEEAAGISKYKARKKEAVNRLGRVEQNLLRIQDIVDEVARQLRSVQIQAGRARKYQEYSRLLHSRRVILTLSRYDELVHRHDDFKELSQQLGDEAGALVAKIDQLEAHESRLQVDMNGLDETIRTCQSESMTTADEIARATSTLHSCRSLLGELQRQNESLDNLIDELAEKRTEAQARLDEASVRRDTLQQRHDRGAEHLAALEEACRTARASQRELTERIEQLKGDLFEILRESSRMQNRLIGLESKRQTLMHQLEKMGTKSGELAGRIESNRQSRTEAASQLETLEHRHGELTWQLDGIRKRQADVAEQTETRRGQLAELREEISSARSRYDLINDMRRRHDGVAAGTRAVLERAEAMPFETGRVLGLLGEMISVAPEAVPTVEAAFGEAAQMIVVDNRATADRVAEFLQDNDAGRATLLALDDLPETDTSADTGFQPVSQLVSCSDEIRPAIDAVLADCVLCPDLDTARRARGLGRRGLTFVTPTGRVLHRHGGLSTGSGSAGSGLIGRAVEMAELEQSLGTMEEKALGLKGELEALEHDRMQLELEHSGTAQDLQNVQEQVNARKVELSRIDQLIRRLEEEQSVMDSETEVIQSDVETSRAEEGDLARTIEEISNRHDQLKSTIAEHEQHLHTLTTEAEEAAEKMNAARVEQATCKQELSACHQQLSAAEQALEDIANRQAGAQREMEENRTRQDRARQEIESTEPKLVELEEKGRQIRQRMKDLDARRGELRTQLNQSNDESRSLRGKLTQVEQELQDSRVQENQSRFEMETIAGRIKDDYDLDIDAIYREVCRFEAALAEYRQQQAEGTETEQAAEGADVEASEQPEDEQAPHWPEVLLEQVPEEIRPYLNWRREVGDPQELDRQVKDIQEKIRRLGNVNLDAIADEQALAERLEFLKGQLTDLETAKTKLVEVIERINVISQQRFLETFEAIRENFQETFRKLFGGGKAELFLENPEEPLECGIDITARPPGKENRSITLLSGGEKTMTTVALLFAIFKAKPSPFCVLDEVDAALDEANIDRFVGMLDEFLTESQFLIVTHSKRTMSAADSIYGVTMQDSGVSKKISVKFENREDPDAETPPVEEQSPVEEEVAVLQE